MRTCSQPSRPTPDRVLLSGGSASRTVCSCRAGRLLSISGYRSCRRYAPWGPRPASVCTQCCLLPASRRRVAQSFETKRVTTAVPRRASGRRVRATGFCGRARSPLSSAPAGTDSTPPHACSAVRSRHWLLTRAGCAASAIGRTPRAALNGILRSRSCLTGLASLLDWKLKWSSSIERLESELPSDRQHHDTSDDLYCDEPCSE